MTGPPEADEKLKALRDLGGQLNDPALKSSARLLILVSLAINGRLSFLDLMRLTDLGKGSLSHHLEKLESAQYIKTRRVMVWGGHRVVAEITDEGLRAYAGYINAMKALGTGSDGGPTAQDSP